MGKRSHVWAGPNEHVVVHRKHGGGGGGGSGGEDEVALKIILAIIGIIVLIILIWNFRQVFEWIIIIVVLGLIAGAKSKK